MGCSSSRWHSLDCNVQNKLQNVAEMTTSLSKGKSNISRTVSRWLNLVLGDSADTLRDIPINSLSVVGVTYSEEDVTAFQDAVKGALPGQPDAPIEFSGPFDTTAAQAASGTGVVPALSGSHTVLSALVGGMTPRSLDIQIGMRQTWETGEPQFGISKSATSGYIITKYDVDPSAGTYSARAVLYPGSALPAFGTAAEA